MKRGAATLLGLVAAPALAFGQVGCLPPVTPFAYAPPKDDPELRQMIDEDYQTYIHETEAYLNCLNAESMRTRDEFDAVFKRYVQFFGREAGIKYDATQ